MTFVRNLGLLAAAMVYAIAAHAGPVNTDGNSKFKPTGKGWGELDNVATANSDGQAGGVQARASIRDLSLHTGNPMMGGVKIYYIWYGTAWDTASKNLLTAFGNGIGGTPYYNINTTYYNHSNVHVSNSVTLAGQTTVGYTYGTNLSDAQIQSVVSNAITTGALPKDTNGIYMVLTDKTVDASSGFCTQYCGWHDHATISGSDIKYAFVGNPETQCASSCGATAPTVNGLPGADAMASIMAHEIEEAHTDPQLNAWYSSYDGQENADKCAWTFGTLSTAANGGKYNVTWGGTKFKVQQNWIIKTTQACGMSF